MPDFMNIKKMFFLPSSIFLTPRQAAQIISFCRAFAAHNELSVVGRLLVARKHELTDKCCHQKI
jgi:hypothetical protein